MTIVYEKIISESIDAVRYVVQEFEKPEEAGSYIENRLDALERRGYTCKIPSENGEVECHNERLQVTRIFAVATKQKFISKREYAAMFAATEKMNADMDAMLKKIGWDFDSIYRKRV